jgi:hypothetical protein
MASRWKAAARLPHSKVNLSRRATNSKKKPAGTGPRALTHSLHCNLSFQFSAAWSPAIGGIFGCKRSPAQAE